MTAVEWDFWREYQISRGFPADRLEYAVICRKPRPCGPRKPLDPKSGHVVLTEFLTRIPRALVRRIPKGVDRNTLPPPSRQAIPKAPLERAAKPEKPEPRKLLSPQRRSR